MIEERFIGSGLNGKEVISMGKRRGIKELKTIIVLVKKYACRNWRGLAEYKGMFEEKEVDV